MPADTHARVRRFLARFTGDIRSPKRDPHLLERDGHVTATELEVFLRQPPGTLAGWSAHGYGPRGTVQPYYDTEDVRAWLTGQQCLGDGD